jgi:hypothetical protein
MDGRADPDDQLETVLDSQDHQRVLAALQSLPKRWQTVLWYTDVLQEKPRNIAPLMGIAPNAVSALVLRARKGLRQAYLNRGDQTEVDAMDARAKGRERIVEQAEPGDVRRPGGAPLAGPPLSQPRWSAVS